MGVSSGLWIPGRRRAGSRLLLHHCLIHGAQRPESRRGSQQTPVPSEARVGEEQRGVPQALRGDHI